MRMGFHSSEDRSDWARRATLVDIFRDGVRSVSDEPLRAGVRVTAGQTRKWLAIRHRRIRESLLSNTSLQGNTA
jgi:hypothetical protein